MDTEGMEPLEIASLPCGIDSLPDEMLLLVWEYLGARDVLEASRVCQRWERLADSRALLVRRRRDVIRAKYSMRILIVAARLTKLANLFFTCFNLHTLIVHERVPLDDCDFKIVSEFPHLRHLDVFPAKPRLDDIVYPAAQRVSILVVNDTIAPGMMRELVYSSNLTQLHMYGRSYYYPPRVMVLLIAARREHLTELTLRCNELPEAGYTEIGRCPNLHVLRLYACWLLRRHGAMSLTSPDKLCVLHITGARMLRTNPLLELINSLPIHLEELVLSGTCFNHVHAAALAEKVPHLRVLELWVTPVSQDALFQLAMNLKELWEFDIDKELSINQLKELAGHPTLKRLRCSRPSDISESEFNAAAGRLAPVATPNMRYGRRLLRQDGVGWRSSLYYHWMVDHPPLPLPSDTPPPAFDNDFDEDYSLFGPDVGRTDDDSNDVSISEDMMEWQQNGSAAVRNKILFGSI